jgi:hypothetical protein
MDKDEAQEADASHDVAVSQEIEEGDNRFDDLRRDIEKPNRDEVQNP